jgi:hypothetical protein
MERSTNVVLADCTALREQSATPTLVQRGLGDRVRARGLTRSTREYCSSMRRRRRDATRRSATRCNAAQRSATQRSAAQRSAAPRFEVRRTVESAGSIARDWAIGPSMMIFTHKICSATWSHGRRWGSIGPRLSAPGLGPPRCHICTGTGPTPATSAPGLGPPLPHLHRDWAHPCHI